MTPKPDPMNADDTAQHAAPVEKPFLQVLAGKTLPVPPVWLMRQAGRYLPEYREVRAQAGGFLDLVYNPDRAAEVTMQPLRRYGFDAAILFSDILVIPQALGQELRFTPGEGPQLTPLSGTADLARLTPDRIDETLVPIYETVRTLRAQMTREGFDHTALIGFAGAPWTIACYMAEGQGSRDFFAAKRWAYTDPDGFSQLIAMITDATIHYLIHQIEAGAEAVQLFDSWAGVADETLFREYIIRPAQSIREALRKIYPDVPLIGFPKGAGALYDDYARETGVSALGLDTQVPLAQAQHLQTICPVQGNLDPGVLLAGGDMLKRHVERIRDALGQGPHIFNLGHGINKDTAPEHVQQLINALRA